MAINILIGFLLDRIFGDPDFSLHPIVLIGKLISILEKLLYELKYKLIGGALLTIFSSLIIFTFFFLLSFIKKYFYLPFSINIISVFFIYFLFCNKTLIKEAKAVYSYLIINDIQSAREQVGRLVGRDTTKLDKKAIIRATIETVAENIVDGFTAPLFYLSIVGLPFAYLYKTINTLDSMVGYKNERYNKFGTPSARLDDILNFIPARLNLFFIYISTGFNREIFKYTKKYAKLHPSPNSGIAESSFSALLGVALGGPSKYGGVLHSKAWLGKNTIDDKKLEDPNLILKTIEIYWKVIYLTLIVFLTAIFIFHLPVIFK